jgi:hypothetical protein
MTLMNKSQLSERVNWLSATLAAQRTNISGFLSRLKGIADRVGTNLSLHRKFLHLMDQVADDRQRELDIIHEIEAVENRHHNLRQHNLLQRIALAAQEKRQRLLEKERDENGNNEEREEETPSRLSLLEIIALLYFFSARSSFFSRFKFFGGFNFSPGGNSQKQEPTVE